MKFMSSSVTSSAAIVKSPSFSRSSSSQTMTILPFLISSMTSSIGLNGIFHSPLECLRASFQPRLQQPLHVFPYDVRLQVYMVSRREILQVRRPPRLGQYRDGERGLADGDEGEADA